MKCKNKLDDKEDKEKIKVVEEIGSAKKKTILDKEGFKCKVGISNIYHDETVCTDDSVTSADVRVIYTEHM